MAARSSADDAPKTISSHEHEVFLQHDASSSIPRLSSDGRADRDDEIQISRQLSDLSEASLPTSSNASPDKAEDGEDASPSNVLKKSSRALQLAIFYSSFAILSWIITCILVYRTIKLGYYEVHTEDNQPYHNVLEFGEDKTDYQKSEDWFRATRVMQAILAILTIPITSAICATAAIVYTQRRRSNLSLRQLMVLADKGWTSPELCFKAIFVNYKIYGSSLLIGAIVLNLLGASISPVQSAFLSAQVIKVPTVSLQVFGLFDLFHLLEYNYAPSVDSNRIPMQVRSALTSATSMEPQTRLWAPSTENCSISTIRAPYCYQGGASLGSLTALPDPFLAQLPSGYSTGLIRQFTYRINSSVTRELVPGSDFPSDCESLPGSFYVQYGNNNADPSIDDGSWRITACMPANQTFSPWKAVEARQDFSEVLYLQLSVNGWGVGQLNGTYKITTNTTGGYFELPNYMNENLPGPLLQGDPVSLCDDKCVRQGFMDSATSEHNDKRDVSISNRQVTNISSDSSAYLQLDGINRGPLLTVAIALFGEGSFVSSRLRNPEAYVSPNTLEELTRNPTLGACIEQVPFVGLLRHSASDLSDVGLPIRGVRGCLTNSATPNIGALQEQLASYAAMFISNTFGEEEITKAFASATFLANQAWMMSGTDTFSNLYYDYGVDTLVPVISLPGIVLISCLLGLYLMGLLTLAVYSCGAPLWTNQLDSYAMMRIGAAALGGHRLRAGKAEKLKVLDKTPGWIGDAEEEEDAVGQLALGGEKGLVANRRYADYPTEKLPPP